MENEYQEMTDAIRQEFDNWLLEEAQIHGVKNVDLAWIQRHYLRGIKYSTLAPIARGSNVPSLITALQLIRARPAFRSIFRLDQLPGAPTGEIAQQIMASLADPHLTDADLAEIAAQVEALRVKRRNHNPLMTRGAA